MEARTLPNTKSSIGSYLVATLYISSRGCRINQLAVNCISPDLLDTYSPAHSPIRNFIPTELPHDTVSLCTQAVAALSESVSSPASLIPTV